MAFHHYRTRGFFINKENRGEADQVLTAFTEDFGKLNILAKAVRKTKSKLRPGADIFHFSEIEFIQGRAYKTLTDAITLEKFKNIKGDLEKIKIAYKISSIADKLIKGQERDEGVYDLLEKTFNKLDNCELPIVQLPILYYYFLWNLLSILGYQMDFYNCALCRKKLTPGKIYFSSERNGLIDQECFKKQKINKGETKEISIEAIKIIRFILNKAIGKNLKLKINKEHLKEIAAISKKYLFSFDFNINEN